MSRTKYLAAVFAAAIFAALVNYLMAIAGAPQQHWFFCHLLELCTESVR